MPGIGTILLGFGGLILGGTLIWSVATGLLARRSNESAERTVDRISRRFIGSLVALVGIGVVLGGNVGDGFGQLAGVLPPFATSTLLTGGLGYLSLGGSVAGYSVAMSSGMFIVAVLAIFSVATVVKYA